MSTLHDVKTETGSERADAQLMLQSIVRAELSHWVPCASQRLIYRAARTLGINQPDPGNRDRECGEASDSWHEHAIVADWVAGLYLYRCVSCYRLFWG